MGHSLAGWLLIMQGDVIDRQSISLLTFSTFSLFAPLALLAALALFPFRPDSRNFQTLGGVL